MPQLERLPYFRCYPADYLLDTRGLTMAQDGAYWLLILHYYWEGSLPGKPAIYRICKADRPAERADVDIVLAQYFRPTDTGYEHARIEREIERLGAMVRSKKLAGQASAEKRWAGHKKATPAPERKPKAPTRAAKANGKHPISDGWTPSPKTLERLAAQFGLNQEQLIQYYDHFVGACKAKDYKYADFDAAFSNAVRADWPKLRAASTPKPDPFNPGPGKAVM